LRDAVGVAKITVGRATELARDTTESYNQDLILRLRFATLELFKTTSIKLYHEIPKI